MNLNPMEAAVSKIPSQDWKDKLKKFIAFFLLATSLSGCAQYQGWVRYPCQEYENWQKAECNPPQCTATGTCTKDLIPMENNG
jgi:hypothetical protein